MEKYIMVPYEKYQRLTHQPNRVTDQHEEKKAKRPPPPGIRDKKAPKSKKIDIKWLS